MTPEGGPEEVSVRIYALAKELGIDNKELLGICDKLGIKGKGSALASLDDDEVAKIKQQLEGAKDEPAPRSAGTAPPTEKSAPIRGDVVSRTSPVRDLNQKLRQPGKEKPAAPRDLQKKPEVKIKVAAMPEVQQPVAKAEPKEKVQKPDIALPQEAIRDAMRKKASSGSSAPLQDFTKAKPKGPRKGGRTTGKPGSPLGSMVETPQPAAGQPAAGPLTGRRKGKRGAERKENVDTGMGSTRQSRQTR
ncbi:MAG: translation initiation factor IF-2 N-terminal domain-containing protein, partial [Pirellulaceae bacterium]